MNTPKNKLFAFLFCLIAGLIFTIVIYNLRFKYLINRSVVITLSYAFLYLFVHYKFRLSVFNTILFTIITPFLIDLSVVFTNIDLVPVRFPFATTFLIVGIALGYFLTRSIKYKLLSILFASGYLFTAGYYIIPNLLNRMEETSSVFKDEYFTTSVLNDKGDTIKLNALTKKALIIDFFFVGCSPCEEKRKMLEELKIKIPDERFEVLLICDGTISSFKQFQEYCNSDPPQKGFKILYDYKKHINTYFPGITGYPYELNFGNNVLLKSYIGFSKETYSLSIKNRIQTIKEILND